MIFNNNVLEVTDPYTNYTDLVAMRAVVAINTNPERTEVTILTTAGVIGFYPHEGQEPIDVSDLYEKLRSAFMVYNQRNTRS